MEDAEQRTESRNWIICVNWDVGDGAGTGILMSVMQFALSGIR